MLSIENPFCLGNWWGYEENAYLWSSIRAHCHHIAPFRLYFQRNHFSPHKIHQPANTSVVYCKLAHPHSMTLKNHSKIGPNLIFKEHILHQFHADIYVQILIVAAHGNVLPWYTQSQTTPMYWQLNSFLMPCFVRFSSGLEMLFEFTLSVQHLILPMKSTCFYTNRIEVNSIKRLLLFTGANVSRLSSKLDMSNIPV